MYILLYNKNMKVGIYCNSTTKKFLPIQEALLSLLNSRGIEYSLCYTPEEIGSPEILIVLGGDGTILKAAIDAGKKGIKILGINSGSLGFLTEFEGEQIERAVSLISGNYTTEKRSVLEICSGGQKWYALNEALFFRRYNENAENNVVVLAAKIDGKKVDTFVGDGIIISTPTGSTAYSLSAGGAILTPDLRAFILTPVCTHSLHNRPIVYSDESKLTVITEDVEDSVALYCDGRFCANLKKGENPVIKKAGFEVEFIKSDDNNFFDRLLFKLNKWSDQRG